MRTKFEAEPARLKAGDQAGLFQVRGGDGGEEEEEGQWDQEKQEDGERLAGGAVDHEPAVNDNGPGGPGQGEEDGEDQEEAEVDEGDRAGEGLAEGGEEGEGEGERDVTAVRISVEERIQKG